MTLTNQPKKQYRLEDFSPEAQAAIQVRAINGSWELRKLVKLLGELAHFDEANEEAMKKARSRMILFIVLAFLGFLAAVFLAVTWTVLGFLIPLLCIVLAVIYGRRYVQHKKADMIDDFRICLRPALRDLAEDLDPNQKVKVRMDLSGPVASKQTGKIELPPGNYIKLTETTYADPWCEVKMPLVDGSTAIVGFEIFWRKLERRYYGRRGKIKSKTKWRKECSASATLLPASARPWNLQWLQARLNPQLERVKTVDKDGLVGARMERAWKFKGESDPPAAAPPARDVVGMLIRLHSAMSRPPEVMP